MIPTIQPVSYRMGLVYPPNAVVNSADPADFMFIQLTLSANNTLAEQVLVRMDAKGSIGSRLLQQISNIIVGVNGAYAYFGPVQLTPIGTPFVGIRLRETVAPMQDLTVIILEQLGLTGDEVLLTLPVQGDYYSIIVVQFDNFTTKNQIYQDYHVHVEPATIIEEQEFNRNIQTLEIAGFGAVIFEGLVALTKERANRKLSPSSEGRIDHNTHNKNDRPNHVERSHMDHRTRSYVQHTQKDREKKHKPAKIKQRRA